MFYSKPLRWPRNRNPLRGMWRRRSDQEAAENLTAFQRQEWIGSSLGARTEKRSEAKTSAPAFSLMAMHFALHSYCIVSPFIYFFVAPTGSKVIIKVSQPILCASQMIKKKCISSFSLKEALLCWRADDKGSSGQMPINLIICREGWQQGMKLFWWQIAHMLSHWINILENSRMLPLHRNPTTFNNNGDITDTT